METEIAKDSFTRPMPDQAVAAAMYKFNTHNYDIQFLAGQFHRDIAVGLG